MHNKKRFNDWAKDYDSCVKSSKEGFEYPFAGYDQLLDEIHQTLSVDRKLKLLDIGFGTGKLTSLLYNDGHEIFGIDFSGEMIKIASEVMPEATLLEWDFSKGLPPEFSKMKFDAIISTYAIHHLTDSKKISFINSLKDNLADEGIILLGDVAFKDIKLHDDCRNRFRDIWDEDEFYIKYSSLEPHLNYMEKDFKSVSFCAGIIRLQ